MRSKITFHIDEAQRVLTAIRDDAALLANLQASAEACFDILPRGGKTLLAGDGGDAFIGYSTSGQSPNILRTIEEARMKGIVCIGLKGSRSGPMQ